MASEDGAPVRGVQGLGFRAFRVYGLGFEGLGLIGFRVQGEGFALNGF